MFTHTDSLTGWPGHSDSQPDRLTRPYRQTDLLVEGVDGELCCVVSAAQGGDIAAHHAGVGLAIILTVPLPILFHHLQQSHRP